MSAKYYFCSHAHGATSKIRNFPTCFVVDVFGFDERDEETYVRRIHGNWFKLKCQNRRGVPAFENRLGICILAYLTRF
jgi:hypothetical protein